MCSCTQAGRAGPGMALPQAQAFHLPCCSCLHHPHHSRPQPRLRLSSRQHRLQPQLWQCLPNRSLLSSLGASHLHTTCILSHSPPEPRSHPCTPAVSHGSIPVTASQCDTSCSSSCSSSISCARFPDPITTAFQHTSGSSRSIDCCAHCCRRQWPHPAATVRHDSCAGSGGGPPLRSLCCTDRSGGVRSQPVSARLDRLHHTGACRCHCHSCYEGGRDQASAVNRFLRWCC